MVTKDSRIVSNHFEGLDQSCVVNIVFAEELKNCADLLKKKVIASVLYSSPELKKEISAFTQANRDNKDLAKVFNKEASNHRNFKDKIPESKAVKALNR